MTSVWHTGFQQKNMQINRFHDEKERKTLFLEAISLEVQYDEVDNICEGSRPNEYVLVEVKNCVPVTTMYQLTKFSFLPKIFNKFTTIFSYYRIFF